MSPLRRCRGCVYPGILVPGCPLHDPRPPGRGLRALWEGLWPVLAVALAWAAVGVAAHWLLWALR